MYVCMYVCRITITCDSGVAWESPNRFVVIVAVVVVVVLGDFNPLRICANPIDTRTFITYYTRVLVCTWGVKRRRVWERGMHACLHALYTTGDRDPSRGIFTLG